jgi:hypothetical protein
MIPYHYVCCVAYWILFEPDWLADYMKSCQSVISYYTDSAPPPLEPYDNNSSNNNIPSHSTDANPKQDNDIEMMSGDWLVFDPVFGVIPHETAQLWLKQAEQAKDKRDSVSVARQINKVKIPPVRYSGKR